MCRVCDCVYVFGGWICIFGFRILFVGVLLMGLKMLRAFTKYNGFVIVVVIVVVVVVVLFVLLYVCKPNFSLITVSERNYKFS